MYEHIKNIIPDMKNRRAYVLKNGWKDQGSKGLHNPYRLTDDVIVHYDHNIIYAMSYMFDENEDFIKLYSFEVNPNHIRKGYGRKAFKDIALEALKHNKGLILSSLDSNSDGFYRSMNMTQNQRVFTANKTVLKQIIRGEK